MRPDLGVDNGNGTALRVTSIIMPRQQHLNILKVEEHSANGLRSAALTTPPFNVWI